MSPHKPAIFPILIDSIAPDHRHNPHSNLGRYKEGNQEHTARTHACTHTRQTHIHTHTHARHTHLFEVEDGGGGGEGAARSWGKLEVVAGDVCTPIMQWGKPLDD